MTFSPDGVAVTEVEGEIAPGFIAMRDATGAGTENNETTRKFTPTADVSRAFDPHHPAWNHLVSHGVTTVLLTPSSSRIAGGLDAIVSPATGTVVKPGAALHLGLSSRALSDFIEPTSYAGLYQHVGQHFTDAADDSPFASAKAGALPVMMEAVSRSETLRAIQFATQHGLNGAVIGAARAHELVEPIKASGLGIVFEPLRPGGPMDAVMSSKALAEAGVPFAFASDASTRGASAMRMTAAACIRGGLDANAALKAMTHAPAALLGVDATHGTLGSGKVADFVVWSGSPP
ncbi:MAG: amidohydrolase family protein [Planctomycetota bacterium]